LQIVVVVVVVMVVVPWGLEKALGRDFFCKPRELETWELETAFCAPFLSIGQLSTE